MTSRSVVAFCALIAIAAALGAVSPLAVLPAALLLVLGALVLSP